MFELYPKLRNNPKQHKIIKYKGVVYPTIKHAALDYGLNPNTVKARLYKNLPLEKVFSSISLIREAVLKLRGRKIKVKNKTFLSISDAAKYYNLPVSTVRVKLDAGYSIKDIFFNTKTDKCVGVVYLISNNKNKKVYIGKTTVPLHRRFSKHLTYPDTGMKFHKAILRIGKKHFKVKILAKSNSKKKLAKLEQKYIKEYNSIKKGYNSNNAI